MEHFIDSLFATNRPLLSGEIAQLEYYILEQETDITRLNGKIVKAASEELLCLLRSQRKERVDCIETLKGFTLPLRRFPAEILSKLFHRVYALSETPRRIGRDHPHRNTAPLQLSAVCQRWRDIALAMPELWQKLFLLEPRPGEEERARIWLSRARLNYPVVLEIDRCDDDHLLSLPSFLHEYGSVIGSMKLSRGHSLGSLDSSVPGFPYAEPELHPQPLPLLRKLELTTPWSLDGFTVAMPISENIPWGQLTHLTIDGCFAATDTAVLMSRCVNLVECFLSISPETPLAALPIAWTIFPALHTLHVTTAHPLKSAGLFPSYSHLFDSLTMPALNELCISDLFEHENLGRLMALKDRSSLDLKSIKILDFSRWPGSTAITGNMLLNFLDNMTSLTSIHIEDIHAVASDEFIEELTLRPTQRQQTLAPNLTDLHIIFRDIPATFNQTDPGHNLRCIMDMVESRCLPGGDIATQACLVSVYLEMHLPPSLWKENELILARAQIFRERGMKIELNSNWPENSPDALV